MSDAGHDQVGCGVCGDPDGHDGYICPTGLELRAEKAKVATLEARIEELTRERDKAKYAAERWWKPVVEAAEEARDAARELSNWPTVTATHANGHLLPRPVTIRLGQRDVDEAFKDVATARAERDEAVGLLGENPVMCRGLSRPRWRYVGDPGPCGTPECWACRAFAFARGRLAPAPEKETTRG